MVLALGIAMAALAVLAASGFDSSQADRGSPVIPRADRSTPAAREDDLDAGPPATAEELTSAICAEILSQSKPEARERLGKLLLGPLSRRIDRGMEVALPCDGRGLLPFSRLSEMYSALAEAYGVPLTSVKVKVGRYTFAVAIVGRTDPAGDEAAWLAPLASEQYGKIERYGNLLTLIFESVVMAAVGTVTSMGVQDAVRAAGGERRLARLMRHYRKAASAGHRGRAERIQGKILRSASRIKGRQVDWSEVEGLVGPTKPPSAASLS